MHQLTWTTNFESIDAEDTVGYDMFQTVHIKQRSRVIKRLFTRSFDRTACNINNI